MGRDLRQTKPSVLDYETPGSPAPLTPIPLREPDTRYLVAGMVFVGFAALLFTLMVFGAG